MNKLYVIVLILMLLAHIFADFHLQGILADMKQEQWWKRQRDTIANTNMIILRPSLFILRNGLFG